MNIGPEHAAMHMYMALQRGERMFSERLKSPESS